MLKEKTLYINLDSNTPVTALVRSAVATTPVSMGTLIAGDTLHLIVVPVTGGETSSLAGSDEYECKVAVGSLGGSPYAQSTLGAVAELGWSGSLDMSTGSLVTPLSTTEELQTNFEVQMVKLVEPDSGSRSTILQAPIILRNQVIYNISE
jgi:hypothetical protein